MALMVLLSTVGCGSRRPPPPPQMKLFLHSDPAINNGQLFYMVVRAINDKQFLTESYQTVAGMVFSDPADKTVLGVHVILPGNKQEFSVEQPEQNSVAFYFLFTDPGDQWKKLVSQPLASSYDVKIEKTGVTVAPKKSLWKRILWPF